MTGPGPGESIQQKAMKQRILSMTQQTQFLALSLLLCCSFSAAQAEPIPSFANGIKIGEVTSTSAVIWIRISSAATADPTSPDAAAPGMAGSVRLDYWPHGSRDHAIRVPSTAVDPERDHTCQVEIRDLQPHTTYLVEASAFSETGKKGQILAAQFKTAPEADQVSAVTALVVTCQGHETVDDPEQGHWVYSHMLTHDPDFFIHTGDVVYYDKGKAQPFSRTVAAARQRWNRMFAYRWNRDFQAGVSSYFMKDDHDTLKNDCWPGQSYGEITWEGGLALFREQTPQGPLPYRSFRWGRDLEFWLMEGRDYRSPNPAPDGPGKSLLGSTQKDWLKNSLLESDATFKLVVFPSPVVGPDKKGKNDNHSNPGFAHEGKALRSYLAAIPNTFVVCGDRHWQYASKDPVTGLVEICCGPINNAHALRGGNAEGDENSHLYYGGGKGGYLRIAVSRTRDIPRIRFIWHGDRSSAGRINHELEFHAREQESGELN